MSPSVEPFDEAKYKALMDGLECKEVLYHDASANKDFRIDSQFYTANILHNDDLQYEPIGSFLISSQYGVSKDMNTDGIGYQIYRMNEIHHSLCDISTDKYVELESTEFANVELKDGDVLFNRTNSFDFVGRTGVYYYCGIPQTFASYLVRFVPDNTNIYSEYLAAFLNTQYGIQEIRRRARQSINQTNVNPEEVKAINIPLLKKSIQEQIRKCYIQAHLLRVKSAKLYDETKTFLKTALGFDDVEIESDSITAKTFSESFTVSGRLDAEYYQPKYEQYHSLITNYKNDYSTIRDEFLPIKEICDRRLATYQYVEIGDVDIGTGSASYNTIATDDLPDNAKLITQKGDIIVSTVRPNRGAVAILEDDGLLVSGAFTVLREQGKYKKEVLQVLLRLPIYRDWLLRYNVGTSYPVIKDDDVLNMPIPLFEDTVQEEIAAKVQESFALRKQSKQLLEFAKQAVEMAIEEGEDKALEWLKSKGVEC